MELANTKTEHLMTSVVFLRHVVVDWSHGRLKRMYWSAREYAGVDAYAQVYYVP